jgi:DNA-binding GntR family transcriptional regulator
MEQVKHAVETGALRAGRLTACDSRKLAEDLVMNPNTVVRAYRELEHEGIVELRHGSGAFSSESVVGRSKLMRKAQSLCNPQSSAWPRSASWQKSFEGSLRVSVTRWKWRRRQGSRDA